MTPHALSRRVADFLCEKIHSIEQLEVVLLVHRVPDEKWTAQRTALTLGIAEASAESALRQLASHGVLACDEQLGPSFWYAPTQQALAQAVDELAQLYPTARMEVVLWISRCAMERIRTAHLRAFAQAFLLKPPKGGR
jgi:hypothetical protein